MPGLLTTEVLFKSTDGDWKEIAETAAVIWVLQVEAIQIFATSNNFLYDLHHKRKVVEQSILLGAFSFILQFVDGDNQVFQLNGFYTPVCL